MNTTRDFDLLNASTKTWKGIVFSPSQYQVVIGSSAYTENARHPNQYSSEWANCVSLAKTLYSGLTPSSTLSFQCYHVSKTASYPSAAITSTKIQIPASLGNKFWDKQTSL